MNVRFEVTVNGERICMAGLDSFGVLSAILTSVERNPERVKQLKLGRSLEEITAPETFLSVGGLDTADNDSDRDVTWKHMNELGPGDEIRIRILSAGEYDPPNESREIAAART